MELHMHGGTCRKRWEVEVSGQGPRPKRVGVEQTMQRE